MSVSYRQPNIKDDYRAHYICDFYFKHLLILKLCTFKQISMRHSWIRAGRLRFDSRHAQTCFSFPQRTDRLLAHSAPYTIGTRGCFSTDKAVGGEADNTLHPVRKCECFEL